MTVSRRIRFRRIRTMMPAKAVEDSRPEPRAVACTRQSPEIWTGPCRWQSCVAAWFGRLLQPAAVGAVTAARPRIRMGGAPRKNLAIAWSFGAGTPFRGNTWARKADSGQVSSGTRAVSCVFSGWPATMSRYNLTDIIYT